MYQQKTIVLTVDGQMTVQQLQEALDEEVNAFYKAHPMIEVPFRPNLLIRDGKAACTITFKADRQEAGSAHTTSEVSRRQPGTSLATAVREATDRVERELIQQTLRESGGDHTQASRKLKISLKSFTMKVRALGIEHRGNQTEP